MTFPPNRSPQGYRWGVTRALGAGSRSGEERGRLSRGGRFGGFSRGLGGVGPY